MCSVQDLAPGNLPAKPQTEFDVLRAKFPGNFSRIVQRSKDGALRVEYDLVRLPEDILLKKGSDDFPAYSWKGRPLPKYFSPEHGLIPTNIRLIWKNRVYDLPAELLAGMTFPMPKEFVSEEGSTAKTRLDFTSVENSVIHQRIPAVDSLKLSAFESKDGRSAMLEMETHSCCCNGDYVRWIIEPSGAVLRHRMAWSELALYDSNENEIRSPFDESGVLLESAAGDAPKPGPREDRLSARNRLLRVPCYGKDLGASVLLDIIPSCNVATKKSGGYAVGWRKLPIMFRKGDAVVRRIDVLWDGRAYTLPKGLSQDLCFPEASTRAPAAGEQWDDSYTNCGSRPRGFLSQDKDTVMLTWSSDAEKGGAVRWIIAKDGTVLRHIGPPTDPES